MSGRIPESEWRWFGSGGHHICLPDCLYHLHTRVGNFRISTVGDMLRSRSPKWVFGDVGLDRKFETYVFRIAGECEQCDPPCGQGEIQDWCEIDSLPANDHAQADANHLLLCHKYAAQEVAS